MSKLYIYKKCTVQQLKKYTAPFETPERENEIYNQVIQLPMLQC